MFMLRGSDCDRRWPSVTPVRTRVVGDTLVSVTVTAL